MKQEGIKIGKLSYIESPRGTKAFENDGINIKLYSGKVYHVVLMGIRENYIETHPNGVFDISSIADFTIIQRNVVK